MEDCHKICVGTVLVVCVTRVENCLLFVVLFHECSVCCCCFVSLSAVCCCFLSRVYGQELYNFASETSIINCLSFLSKRLTCASLLFPWSHFSS